MKYFCQKIILESEKISKSNYQLRGNRVVEYRNMLNTHKVQKEKVHEKFYRTNGLTSSTKFMQRKTKREAHWPNVIM